VTAATLLAGSASGERSVAVSLSVAGTGKAVVTTTKGKTVSVVARAAMRAGDSLLIGVSRGRETRLRGVAVCPRSPCTGRWVERVAASDRFQAFLTRGSGTSFAALGKSRVVRVTWKAAPAPPAPAAPPATPGHYEGRSSFNEIFNFDVSADGNSVVKLQTGQINESCTPSAHISGGNLLAPGPYPVGADGSFSITASISITVNNTAGTRKITITGRFAGATATGTIRTDTSFTLDGTGYTCTSGDQTWSASKV